MKIKMEVKRRILGPHKHTNLTTGQMVECPDGEIRWVADTFDYFGKRVTWIYSYFDEPYTYPEDADFYILLVTKFKTKGPMEQAHEREHLEVRPGYAEREADIRAYEARVAARREPGDHFNVAGLL